jgi:hypothetical protein
MLADFPKNLRKLSKITSFFLIGCGESETLQVLLYDDLAKRDKVNLDIFSARLLGI